MVCEGRELDVQVRPGLGKHIGSESGNFVYFGTAGVYLAFISEEIFLVGVVGGKVFLF